MLFQGGFNFAEFFLGVKTIQVRQSALVFSLAFIFIIGVLFGFFLLLGAGAPSSAV